MKAQLDEIEKVRRLWNDDFELITIPSAICPILSTNSEIGVRRRGPIFSSLHHSQANEVKVIHDRLHLFFLPLKAAEEEQQEVE